MLWCPNCKMKFDNDNEKKTCPVCGAELIEASLEDTTPAGPAFVKSSDKYEDLNSSAITLIFTAVAGYVFLVLKILNIIPLNFQGATQYLFYIVMGSLFTIFLITGIFSFVKAKKIKSNISSEEDTTQNIIDYFSNNYSNDKIDTAIDAASLGDGEIYYNRYEYIKNIINEHFDNISESYMDHLVEEVYSRIYPE